MPPYPRSVLSRIVLGLGAVLCLLGAFGVPAGAPVDVFELGAAIAFGSGLIP